ncbi:MAG: hypothetical protein KA319_12190 [Ferruginibacter sp.]|nr:hypothetical protein [Ferruginibacter sp.]
MKYFIPFILISVLFACNNGEKIPDVSNIKVDIKTQRFEEDLFKKDTDSLIQKIDKLQAAYTSFGENFFATILNVDPKWNTDTAANYINGFITTYNPVFDSTKKMFSNFNNYETEIKKGLQFIKHYFPAYKTPEKVITYIGPLDGYGDILSDDAIIVGLHHHLGSNFSLYQSEMVQQVYPSYITNRFTPDYIAVNAMKNIVNDIYPEKLEDKSLMQQMVEKGKHLYILSKILPKTKEHLLIGYTEQQLKDCYTHEKVIWDLFVQNNFLQTIDNNVIKNYIGESPKTQELGEASPGNIGSFAGWQIVKKYMKKNNNTTLQQLIALDNEAIFSDAKYKP